MLSDLHLSAYISGLQKADKQRSHGKTKSNKKVLKSSTLHVVLKQNKTFAKEEILCKYYVKYWGAKYPSPRNRRFVFI